MQKNCNNALRRIDKKRAVCYNADIGAQPVPLSEYSYA